PPYEEVVHSKLVILWGHNPISTAPHFMPFLRKAQAAGTRLVVIDPRRTPSARVEGALFLAPRPGTDGALALGVAHILVRQGWHDEAWLQRHTVGWPALRERLGNFTPGYVASVTGLCEEDVFALAQLYASVRPGLIKIADGINRNRNGGQNVRAILTLPAITGQYGTPRGGPAHRKSGFGKWGTLAVAKVLPTTRGVDKNRRGAAPWREV